VTGVRFEKGGAVMRGLGLAACVVLGWLLWPPSASAAELPSPTQDLLRTSDYIYTATRRKSGERSSIAPEWFYYEGGDELFFTTSPGSWKAKRIAKGSPLYIWVGDKKGPHLIGEARRVDDAALIDRMGAAYNDKYWIAWMGFFRPRSDRVTSGKTMAYMVRLRAGD
jgi:hypothetical protein